MLELLAVSRLATPGFLFPLVKTQCKALNSASRAEFCEAGGVFLVNLQDCTLGLGEDLTQNAGVTAQTDLRHPSVCIGQCWDPEELYPSPHCPLLHPTGGGHPNSVRGLWTNGGRKGCLSSSVASSRRIQVQRWALGTLPIL